MHVVADFWVQMKHKFSILLGSAKCQKCKLPVNRTRNKVIFELDSDIKTNVTMITSTNWNLSPLTPRSD